MPPPPRPPNVTLENVRITFRNFKGRETQFNQEGYRNFLAVVDEDVAEHLAQHGWNVKRFKPSREDQEETGNLVEGEPFIPVFVRFDKYPPLIVMITSNNRTILEEDQVEILDLSDFANVDLVITPYIWEMNGNYGIKAYVKSMYVTIEEDDLAKKYAETNEQT